MIKFPASSEEEVAVLHLVGLEQSRMGCSLVGRPTIRFCPGFITSLVKGFVPVLQYGGIIAHVVRGIEADQIKGEIASRCFVTGSGCLQLHTKTADIKLSSVLG